MQMQQAPKAPAPVLAKLRQSNSRACSSQNQSTPTGPSSEMPSSGRQTGQTSREMLQCHPDSAAVPFCTWIPSLSNTRSVNPSLAL